MDPAARGSSTAMPEGLDPLANSATVEELIEATASNDEAVAALVESLVWHATPRFVCEVREVDGLPPSFTTTSVSNMRVDGATGRLMLTLNGCDAEIACEEYMRECLDLPAFRGFSFFVVTPLEDRVNTLGVAPILLRHRMVLFRPTNLTDFTLCIVQMYLENCCRERATSSLFVQVEVFLRRLARTITPVSKMRKLMYVGVSWVFNTLMSVTSHSPFDQSRVLPNYMIAKMLLGGAENPPAILEAIYNAGYGSKLTPKSLKRCPAGVMRCQKALLNAPLFTQVVADTLYSWWVASSEKLGPSSLYVLYDGE
ncbi:tegument protein UL7 [Equid alphaherpesvirus 3]|uniref:Tegument protein UL7 n=1 Tax=Equid alphaherpesvirus 3 TaxID=80341 RepID=A0A077B9E4_9ALPH|nr:tegument protein UL7 [Equid alphaherpesvirus 3]AIL02972.1 tegument protein UL7 [Equid alphaherpesvirus 3]